MNANRVGEVSGSGQENCSIIFKISGCSSCEGNTVFILLGCVRYVNNVVIC